MLPALLCYSTRMKNPLTAYFEKNKDGRLIHKWMHYFDIYHAHFAPFRKKQITIVEFGVYHGGSLQMWKKYFGKKARIIGVDINPVCKQVEEKQIEVFIGDQENRDFLRTLRKEIGRADIIIDDGGHQMGQQIATFQEMFPILKDGGVYLIEDLHTSYWKEYGGAYKKNGTFIELAKDLIDQINANHSRDQRTHKITEYTKTIKAMHVYDSVIVFDKGKVEPLSVRKMGKESFNFDY